MAESSVARIRWGTLGPSSEFTEAENLDLSRVRCKHRAKDSVGTEIIWKQVSWHHINMGNEISRVGVSRLGVDTKGQGRQRQGEQRRIQQSVEGIC
jgi:hypothetical protein